MKRIPVLTMLTALVALWTLTVFGAVPQLISFQGSLRDGSGNPVANGSYSATFRIYDAASGGNVLWSESTTVTTSGGVFIVLLGSLNPVPDTVFNDPNRWLGTTVSPDPEMTPRQRLASVGYAIRTEQWTSAAQDLFRLNGNVGIGTTPSFDYRLEVYDTNSAPSAILALATAYNATGNAYGVEALAHTLAGNAYGGFFDGSTNNGTAYGVFAHGDNYGVFGRGYTIGGQFTGLGGGSYGVNTSGLSRGVNALGPDYGVVGTASNNGGAGVFGQNSGNIFTYGVYSSGDARVTRNLTVDGDIYLHGSIIAFAGATRIDHPLDPANKYLYHSSVESPDMKNIYDGVVTTDAKGEATVTLPDWFGAVNKDFRYQLTVIGVFAQAIISKKIEGNRFSIKTDQPNVEVSWQVTGVRKDPAAEAHRIPVEEVKTGKERGKYLYPEEYGVSPTLGMNYEEEQRMAAEQKKMEEERVKMAAEHKQMEEEHAKMERERLLRVQELKEKK